jgi:putative phosphoribosyl transferase
VEESNDSDTKRDNRGQIMERETEHRSEERAVRISAGGIELEGNLGVVDGAGGVVDLRTRQLRFDIVMLAERLVGATDWLRDNPDTQNMRIGYFGASTGAGAALVAAAERPDEVGAVVSRGGRPDLAGEALSRVEAPTLLIVGGSDVPVIGMNEEALGRMHVEKRLEIVPGATHLFEEVGALKEVARLAAAWFRRYLAPRRG